MMLGVTLSLELSVELQLGTQSNTADMYMSGEMADGIHSGIVDMHGGAIGEIGTGARKIIKEELKHSSFFCV